MSVEALRPGHVAPLGDLATQHGQDWTSARITDWFGGARVSHHGTGGDAWAAALPDLCRAGPSGSAARAVARQLLEPAWAGLDQALTLAVRHGQASAVRTRMGQLGAPVAGILEGAVVTGDTRLRDRLVGRLMAEESLAECVITVLRVLASRPDDARHDPAVTRLVRHAADVLRARLDRPVRADDDWAITTALHCDCALCPRLATFLADHDERHLEWPLAQQGREHVERQVTWLELPVTHQTRRTGRPYTLVLEKSRQLFQREQRARLQDQRDLDRLAADWAAG
jgi:hypothetical protein